MSTPQLPPFTHKDRVEVFAGGVALTGVIMAIVSLIAGAAATSVACGATGFAAAVVLMFLQTRFAR